MKHRQVDNALVLSNAVELATQVVTKVAGNGIGNVVNGEPVNGAVIRQAVAARIKTNLTPHLGGVQ